MSGLVKSVEVPGRCDFGTGVVIPAEPVSWESIPDPFQPAYTMVTQSQIKRGTLPLALGRCVVFNRAIAAVLSRVGCNCLEVLVFSIGFGF